LLTNAEFKLPKVPDAAGNEIQLSQGNYVARFLESHDRDERKRAFEAMLGTYAQYKNTISATYSARVKADMFYAKSRHYENCLHQALESINVPVSVYTTLVETVEKNLPALHRYLRLRKKVMGLADLHMYDLYVPMVKEVEYKIAFEHAREKVVEALAPLGKEYVDALKSGMGSRWIDVVETHGKRSGAYSWGAFGTNPFVLLNYQESMDSMFTLAHEMGHSMHSYFTRSSQPFQYADYTLFVAEVASTCNEALLTDYLLKNTDDKALRMYIINHALEGFRTTLFRQTLFAEFEMQAHAAAEAGQALTPEYLCSIFKALNEKYYGAEVIVDDAIEIEWARIPHFYSSFYVYQYATGISAATAQAKQIVNEGQPAVLRYLGFLSSGSSDYSIELLKKAGVDLSTPQPIQDALDTFSKYVDQFDALC
jgi:oligoendopeptidase F